MHSWILTFSILSSLLDDVQLKVALLAQHRDADVDGVLLEQEIHLTKWQLEIQQANIGQKGRKDGPIDAQTSMVGFN